MSEIKISNGCLNEENIKSLVDIPKNEERICLALYSPIAKKATIFHCKEEDSIRTAIDIYQDLILDKYLVVTIQVPLEEINSIVCMAEKLSPEIVLDYFFEIGFDDLILDGTRRFQKINNADLGFQN